MPKTLTPVNVFPASIPNFPLAGNNEPLALGPLEAAFQALLNRSEHTKLRVDGLETTGVKRVQRVASLAALQNLAGMSDGDTVDVEGYGRYRLYNPSALAADGLWVLTAAGGGRWVHLLNLMRGGNSGLATLTPAGRLSQDVRDGSILAQHLADGSVTTPKLADQGVTAAKLAPGSVVGHLGYTPVNRAGDTMSGVLTVAPNIGQALSIKGGSADHAYLAFYARSANQNQRSGYIGYPASATSDLNIQNEISGGRVLVQGSEVPIERGDILFSTNWNLYTSPGYYRVVEGGASAANTPPANYGYGTLVVFKAGTAITQIYTQHTGGRAFARQAWGGSDWAPWAELGTAGGVRTSVGLSAHWELRTTGGANRWRWELFGGETGGNAGSSLRLTHFGDDGTNYLRLDAPRSLNEFQFYSLVTPAADNTYGLGNSARRWAAVWAANGTIQTSDAREKTDVRTTPLGLAFVERLRPVAYRWRVGGYADEPVVEERQVQVGTDAEGNPVYETERHAKPNPVPVPGRRVHHGLIAQEVRAVLDEFGVDFGGWVLTDPADPDSQQALRYDQFIAPLIRAVQELSEQVRELAERVEGPGQSSKRRRA